MMFLLNKFAIFFTSFLVCTGFYFFGQVTPTKVAFIVFFFIVLLNVIGKKGVFFKVSIFDIVTILVLILALLSQSWSSNLSESIPILISYTYYVLFYFLARIFFFNRPHLIEVAKMSILSAGVFSSVIGVFQFLTGYGYMPGTPVRSLTTDGINRACGMFTDPNYFGFVLVCLWPLALSLSRKVSRFLVLSIISIATILTLSRATYLIVLLQLVGLIYISSKNIWYFFSKLFFMVIFTILVSYFFLPEFVSRRLDTLLPLFQGDLSQLENSASERIDLFFAGVRIFFDHPILGVGFGNFQLYSSDYMQLYTREVVAHNSYITVAAELGLLGFVPWMFGLIVICVNVHKSSLPFFIGIIGVLASYFFLVANYFHFLAYYFAILVSTFQLFKKHHSMKA